MPECEDVNERFLRVREKMRERGKMREGKITKSEIMNGD